MTTVSRKSTSFSTLPTDIFVAITEYCTLDDLFSLRLVAKFLARLLVFGSDDVVTASPVWSVTFRRLYAAATPYSNCELELDPRCATSDAVELPELQEIVSELRRSRGSMWSRALQSLTPQRAEPHTLHGQLVAWRAWHVESTWLDLVRGTDVGAWLHALAGRLAKEQLEALKLLWRFTCGLHVLFDCEVQQRAVLLSDVDDCQEAAAQVMATLPPVHSSLVKGVRALQPFAEGSQRKPSRYIAAVVRSFTRYENEMMLIGNISRYSVITDAPHAEQRHRSIMACLPSSTLETIPSRSQSLGTVTVHYFRMLCAHYPQIVTHMEMALRMQMHRMEGSEVSDEGEVGGD